MDNQKYLFISDIHFFKNTYTLKYHLNNVYDYLFYVGGLLQNNFCNDGIITNMVFFFKNINAKKKIIILGKTDYTDIDSFINYPLYFADTLYAELRINAKYGETFYVINSPRVIDDIYCAPYLYSLNDLDKYKMIVVHKLENSKTTLKNKLIIHGHEHIVLDKKEDVHPGLSKIDDNIFVNVSISSEPIKYDRKVYFTLIEFVGKEYSISVLNK